MASDVEFKTCPGCDICKPLTLDFWQRHKKKGVPVWTDYCHECSKRRGREYYARNKKAVGIKALEARNKDREKYRVRAREYAEKRRSARLEYVDKIKRGIIEKVYRINKRCPACEITKHAVEFYNTNRTIDGLTSYCKRCTDLKNLSRKSHGGKTITSQTVDSLLENQNNQCWYCDDLLEINNRSSYHVEHKMPISRGGNNEDANLCISCSQCNLVKNNLSDYEFFKSNRFLKILINKVTQNILKDFSYGQ